MIRNIIAQSILGGIFYCILYMMNAPHWACLMFAFICVLIVELIDAVNRKLNN